MCDKKSCAYTLLKCYLLFPATELDLILQTLKQMSLKKGENISCVVKVLGARLKIAYQKSHTAFFFLFPVQSEWNAKEVVLSPRTYSPASQGNKLSFTSPPPPSQKSTAYSCALWSFQCDIYIALTSKTLQVWHLALFPLFNIPCSELSTHRSLVFPIMPIMFLFFLWLESNE